jgi:hypothetical protein
MKTDSVMGTRSSQARPKSATDSVVGASIEPLQGRIMPVNAYKGRYRPIVLSSQPGSNPGSGTHGFPCTAHESVQGTRRQVDTHFSRSWCNETRSTNKHAPLRRWLPGPIAGPGEAPGGESGVPADREKDFPQGRIPAQDRRVPSGYALAAGLHILSATGNRAATRATEIGGVGHAAEGREDQNPRSVAPVTGEVERR